MLSVAIGSIATNHWRGNRTYYHAIFSWQMILLPRPNFVAKAAIATESAVAIAYIATTSFVATTNNCHNTLHGNNHRYCNETTIRCTTF